MVLHILTQDSVQVGNSMIEPTKQIEHHYDGPDLSPKEFLLAVMNDPAVPLSLRVDAAHRVAPYVCQPAGTWYHQPTINIRIPFLPGQFEPIVEQDKETVQ
jgi:hypothetical protein